MSKKKKNRCGKLAVESRKNKVQGTTVRYKCLECGIEEEIPRSVVEMFDALDDEGDISVPPRFDCEKCRGLMEPLEYSGVHGIKYKMQEDTIHIQENTTIYEDEEIKF
jgi:hypothetical protein